MALTERQWIVLRELAASTRAQYGGPWARPMDVGGTGHNGVAAVLNALIKKGLAERKRRSVAFIRGSYLYRCTDEGLRAVDERIESMTPTHPFVVGGAELLLAPQRSWRWAIPLAHRRVSRVAAGPGGPNSMRGVNHAKPAPLGRHAAICGNASELGRRAQRQQKETGAHHSPSLEKD